jgi:hypothetical protein
LFERLTELRSDDDAYARKQRRCILSDIYAHGGRVFIMKSSVDIQSMFEVLSLLRYVNSSLKASRRGYRYKIAFSGAFVDGHCVVCRLGIKSLAKLLEGRSL